MSRTHSQSKTKLYRVWSGIISRCEDATNTAYRDYGGRGIAMCAEWRESFVAFRDWAHVNGYVESVTEIDRYPDNDGNYEPTNCRWVTRRQNMRNRRSSVWVSAFGETKTAIEWSEDPRCAVNYLNLLQRIRRHGWDAERAITTPVTVFIRGLNARIPVSSREVTA